MRVDISLLPALAAAFMLVFARIGAMVMLLPGLGESNIPVRIKLAIALVLTLVICRCIAPPTRSTCSRWRRYWF
jgi:flagellar biosynthetic protein FliR